MIEPQLFRTHQPEQLVDEQGQLKKFRLLDGRLVPITLAEADRRITQMAYERVLLDVSVRHRRAHDAMRRANDDVMNAPKGQVTVAKREAEYRRATEWRLRQVLNYLTTFQVETANMSDEGYLAHLKGDAANGQPR